MKLFSSYTSPYARKIRFIIDHASLGSDIEIVLNDPSLADELSKGNPLVKIPCLFLDNGDSLYDSTVIAEYLDTKYDIGLFPSNFETRINALKWQSLAQGMMDASVLIFMEKMKPVDKQMPDRIEMQAKKLRNALDSIIGNLDKIGKLSENVNIGNLSIAIALEYMILRVSEIYNSHSKTEHHDLIKDAHKIPAFKNTTPPMG